MTLRLTICLLVLLLTPAMAWAGTAEDEAGVRQAVLDYVEGVYEVDPSRIERSVHPDLAKHGFYRPEPGGPYKRVPMTFDRLVQLATNYNKDGHIPKDAPKEVILFEVLDKTASIKLVASWGIDFMHLAKEDGKWKIVYVLWQGQPEE